jgi:hypothetical protein
MPSIKDKFESILGSHINPAGLSADDEAVNLSICLSSLHRDIATLNADIAAPRPRQDIPSLCLSLADKLCDASLLEHQLDILEAHTEPDMSVDGPPDNPDSSPFVCIPAKSEDAPVPTNPWPESNYE